MNGPFALSIKRHPSPSASTPAVADPSTPTLLSGGFSKSSRILKRSEFRKVYDQGKRMTCPYFAAFFFSPPEDIQGPLFGFTTPRVLGKANIRNRLRRRVREAVRLEKQAFGRSWMIVFNPRRPALNAPFEDLRREVAKVAGRCK